MGGEEALGRPPTLLLSTRLAERRGSGSLALYRERTIGETLTMET